MKKTIKSHQSWSWILIILFFSLSIVNIKFGILGIICFSLPVYHALRGRGKIHCSKYCPRGSFLGKFLSEITLNNPLPKFMKTKQFKTFILLLMLTMFSIAMIKSNFQLTYVAFSLFRLMGVSFIVGIILGVFYKPRSWCQICPMGYGTGLITKYKNNKN
ncbi:MAG: 4Fe-4S ferredoxin [Vallitalea sp.]|jgi:hypothetical protein|nr:4Fe-4S ferredoxin [Vallitalea sp.]